MSPSPVLYEQTNTLHGRARVVTSSEAASLGGKPAKTPVIAGSICGGIMLIAWAIGFGIYFRKRYNRKKRKRLAEAGKCEPPREKLPKSLSSEKILIPPDPAVLLGIRKPGEVVYPLKDDPSHASSSSQPSHHRSHSKSHPATLTADSIEDEMTIPLNPNS